MSDNRKGRVSPHALNELISLSQKHTPDTHAAPGLLAVAAYSLMMSSGIKTFEAAADNGAGDAVYPIISRHARLPIGQFRPAGE
ncbi:TPA: hypothetical protein JEL83_002922 [Salmonella enterica subsp. enterica serovar Elisabethville]|nr:hypothetical protein [Salmonella enterica subsp. enterica serovar Elisabethville]